MWYNIGMSEINPIRVDTLPGKRNKYTEHWKALSAACRAEPGQWYTLPDIPANFASQLRAGKMTAFTPVKEWEAEVIDKVMYVRYVGGGKDDS